MQSNICFKANRITSISLQIKITRIIEIERIYNDILRILRKQFNEFENVMSTFL